MENQYAKHKFSIRKYSIGVVSVLAATTFWVSGHHAQAAEEKHLDQKQSGQEAVQGSASASNSQATTEGEKQAGEDTNTEEVQYSLSSPESTNVSDNQVHHSSIKPQVEAAPQATEKAETQQDANNSENSVISQSQTSPSTNKEILGAAEDNHQSKAQALENHTLSRAEATQSQEKAAADATVAPAQNQTDEAQNNTQAKEDHQKATATTDKKVQDQPQQKRKAPEPTATPSLETQQDKATPSAKRAAPTNDKIQTTPTRKAQQSDKVRPTKEQRTSEQKEPSQTVSTLKRTPEHKVENQVTSQHTPQALTAVTPKSIGNQKTNVSSVVLNPKAKTTFNQNAPTPTPEEKAAQVIIDSNQVRTNNRSTTLSTTAEALARTFDADKAQYINQYPIVFVHGFLGLVGNNAPALYPDYWGGNKYKVIDELTAEGYNVHRASVGAFSSNYDRAVELYYYIKGGRVDYGAAHAEKYGHSRYGRFYEGIMPDWEPGKKIHFVGHSMGGQTIRLLEHFLRFGNQEEIDYQAKHGGEISPLFVGNQDNMIASITTLGTPHNGSQAADKLANTDAVRNVIYALNRLSGSKNSTYNLGLGQWGLIQDANENYIEYSKRVNNSRLWTTTDNASYDLTLEGSAKLNELTKDLNPNIVYTTYTGAASHAGPLGYHNPNFGQFFLLDLTSRIIGRDANIEWRKNDGVVPVISSLHPSNQDYVDISADELATRKGIWQVRPVMEDWDHIDFVGLDAFDLKHTGAELANFYAGLINNLLRVEELDALPAVG